MRWLLGAAIGVAAGCLGPRGFACLQDSECTQVQDGSCESGWCAYPDTDCESGHRFVDNAGDDLAGLCTDVGAVDVTGSSDSSAVATESTDTTGEADSGGSSSTGGIASCGGLGQSCCPDTMCDQGLSCEDGDCLCAIGLAAGGSHTCATGAGWIQCWGDDAFGQLGPMGGGARPKADPIPVLLPNIGSNIPFVVAADHSCVIHPTQERIACWGRNDFGQVNAMAPSAPHPALEDVVAWSRGNIPAELQAVGVGQGHSCVATGANVYCWGDTTGGKAVASPYAMTDPVGNTKSVVALSLGLNHSCALFKDPTMGDDVVYCWGPGPPITGTQAPTNEGVVGLPAEVTAIAAGGMHNCAIGGDGALYCWGSNANAQLGLGEIQTAAEAVLVPGVEGPVTAVSAGMGHTCAIGAGGRLWCWGGNNKGQTRPGDNVLEVSEASELGEDALGASTFRALSAGSQHTCAIATDGRLLCWGDNETFQLGSATAASETVVELDLCG